jgi:uncharacterized membrane protein
MHCGHCGAYVPEGSRFCAACGREVGAPSGGEYQYRPTYSQEDAANDIQDNKLISILCYFGILLLIPYLIKPNSAFVKYHSNQGLLLLLLGVACGVVSAIPVLGWIVGFVVGIFVAVCFIIGLVNVISGKMSPLPIIGKYTIIK